MQTFFFIPANRIDKLLQIKEKGVTEIIIDLEDAVKDSEKAGLLEQILKYPKEDIRNCFFRIPLIDLKGRFNFEIFDRLLENGFTRFVFPKMASFNDFTTCLQRTKIKLEVILLVETPRLYIECFTQIYNYYEHIYGLALGSHDFIAAIHAKHTVQNLEVLRQQILYFSKAYDILSIDIASMNIKDEDNFREELMDGFNKGYDGKFIIHPNQLEIVNKTKFYSNNDFAWALKVQEKLNKRGGENEFDPILIDDKVVEKPHIKLAKRIINEFRK
ncbi:HpcH/HpaI aldolase/citrate lyase family protein [Flagellimonas marina]|jgi:citrate lyase beta subunit|uniref:HpcH/HpaI aldolase/citrate lyase family protein n=1 Tax=Flagellimonas marina TaxID=1775168 RepID=A0ABV8PRJ9_9FLAO